MGTSKMILLPAALHPNRTLQIAKQPLTSHHYSTHHSCGRRCGRPSPIGPGEERLDDHGLGAGGEVRLRCGPSVDGGRGGDRLLPARGAGEVEACEAALVAARDRDEGAAGTGVARLRDAGGGGPWGAAGPRGGGQAQRRAGCWSEGGGGEGEASVDG